MPLSFPRSPTSLDRIESARGSGKKPYCCFQVLCFLTTYFLLSSINLDCIRFKSILLLARIMHSEESSILQSMSFPPLITYIASSSGVGKC